MSSPVESLAERLDDLHQLAGVLAHEVQHVEQRHSLQALVKNLGLRGLWMMVTGDISGSAIGQASLELTSLSFSRDAEEQADAAGFDGLVAISKEAQRHRRSCLLILQAGNVKPCYVRERKKSRAEFSNRFGTVTGPNR